MSTPLKNKLRRDGRAARTKPRGWKPSQEQLDHLNEMLLPRLKTLQRELAVLEMAGRGPALLTGKKRADMIRRSRLQVEQTELSAQVLACKLLLNVQCPGWEAEAPDLARLIADRIPPGCTWVDSPVRDTSCH
jgi:hypothetical protein